MFNLSGSEIVVILLLALVVLGPEKLPDAIRRFGRTYAELKKMGTGFQQEFKSALDEPMREMRETADLLKKSADFTATDTSSKPSTTTATNPSRATTPTATTETTGDPVSEAVVDGAGDTTPPADHTPVGGPADRLPAGPADDGDPVGDADEA